MPDLKESVAAPQGESAQEGAPPLQAQGQGAGSLLARWRYRMNRASAALLQRVVAWLDRNAERQGGGWGATMEYRHRYTTPDEAIRARGGLPERRQRERRADPKSP